MRKTLQVIFGWAVMFGAMLAAPLAAQSTNGVVVGQVTDATGAAVAKASITLSSAGTGISRATTANGGGEYSFNDVPIGLYVVTVTSPSFEKSVTKDVKVDVASIKRVDAKLVAGSTSETVEISATSIQVDTSSGALGTVVDGTQVKELPLNGRSFVELTQLGPGVSGANNFDSKNKGLQGGVDFSVNGNPTTNNLFLVDGANDNDVGSNRTILVYPSIESIAEFKMLTNSYGPEYGQASGAIISIATRNGTNALHGSVFYSGRNDALAAYTYFARHNAGLGQPLDGKDKLRRNDWGYSVGGPIKKDKLFFFFNQEFNRQINGFSQASCVATAAERAGDFTTVGCGAASPNIPVAYQKAGNPKALANVDAAGALLAQYFPLPNKVAGADGNNWSRSLPSAVSTGQEHVRIDFNVTPRNTIMGSYTQDHFSNPSYNGNQYWGDTPFPVINGGWAQPSKMAIGRWTSTISQTLVNDAEFAYSNNRITVVPGGSNAGLLNQLASAIPTLYPQSLKTAAASTPTIWSGLGQYGNYNNIWSIAPWNNSLDIYTMRDDVSKVAGRHTLKVGAFVGIDGKNEDSGAASTERPTFQTFDYSVAIPTGNNLANILLPNNPVQLAETSTNIRAQLRWKDIEFYAGDSYKVTPRVTLNYGLRYSLLRNPVQPADQITSFQPQLYDASKPASDACNGLWIVAGTDPCGDANKKFGTSFSHGVNGPNRALVNNNNHLIAPRVGVAWDVRGDGRSSLRAGLGQFFQRERVSRYTLVANAPFAVTTSNYARALGGATPATLSGGGASPSGGMDPRAILPNTIQWNLTFEQEMAKDTALQVSYVGNRGIHLTSSYDINAVSQGSIAAATFQPGGLTNAQRRFSNYGALAYWSHNGDSNYHSLQTLFRTQVSSFRMQAAYTWSHAIADVLTDDSSGGTGAQSFTYYPNPRLDRGNAATNRPNIFVANVTYFAPKLAGRGFVARNTLGGWEITGITQANSGNSFSVYQGANENTANVVVGAVGAGALNSLAQTGLTGNQRPLITTGQNCNSSGRQGSQVYNPTGFTLIGYHLGTLDPAMAPRGACQGPRLVNTDLSLDKNWRIRERVTVQFRLDFFDLLNHANFRADQTNATPIASVNCGAANAQGLYQPCSVSNSIVSAQTRNNNFGVAYGLVGNAQRQLQYGLHVEF